MNIKQISFVIIVIAAAATFSIGLVSATPPLTAGVFGFIGWSVTPYVYLAVLITFISKKHALISVLVLVLVVVGFGLWAFIDSMFIHPDAQGALVFVVIPVWQLGVLLLATLPICWLNKK